MQEQVFDSKAEVVLEETLQAKKKSVWPHGSFVLGWCEERVSLAFMKLSHAACCFFFGGGVCVCVCG